MKKVFKFLDLFLGKLAKEFIDACIHILFCVFGIVVINVIWRHSIFGKILLIATGVSMIITSIVEAVSKMKDKEIDPFDKNAYHENVISRLKLKAELRRFNNYFREYLNRSETEKNNDKK